MKVAIISPIPMMRRYCITNYQMALTHLVLDCDEYAQFYRERSLAGDYVMLDNSVIELGSSVDIPMLIEAAERVKAKEIILPDAYGNRLGTLNHVTNALEKYSKQLAPYKLMVVAQGKGLEDWVKCHDDIVKMFPEINTIGIPKNTSQFLLEDGRWGLCQFLHEAGLVDSTKDYHLLGLWDDPLEIKHISQYKWVRGVDTVNPVVCGMHGIAYHEQLGLCTPRPKKPIDFYNAVDAFPAITRHNVYMLNWWGAGL